MTDLGLGVLLHLMSDDGEETAQAVQSSLGKTIKTVALVETGDGELKMQFTDDTILTIWDDGRSCCESRYITCDDKLSDFDGAVLTKIEVADAPTIEEEYGPHEQQFLVVTTGIGSFTCETHNEHNGYYGGFYIKARLSS